jgi:hypothetical protein
VLIVIEAVLARNRLGNRLGRVIVDYVILSFKIILSCSSTVVKL